MGLIKNQLALVAAVALTLTAVGCAGGGLDDLLGGGDTTPRGTAGNELYGTVAEVDRRNQVIAVRPDDRYRADLRRGSDVVALHYDAQTRVTYQGREYRPEDLEPGDQIVALVDASGRRLEADRIQVTQDVRAAGDDRFTERGRYDRYDRSDDHHDDYYGEYGDRYRR